MRRLRMLLVATALIAGSSVLASAQGWGYHDGYYRNDRAMDNARHFGYQDGLNDGRNDRITGHSFRPTHDGNFKHADRGYYGGIDRNYYTQAYREAYENGYQRGYDSANYRGYDRDRDGWRRY